MEENKNPVVDGTTENVDTQATEQYVNNVDNVQEESVQVPQEEKLYSEADFNKKLDELLAKKLARKEAKLKRDYENKYSRIENVLTAGLGTDDLNEATDKLEKFYKQRGVNIPTQPKYSDRDIELLASAEANDIISSGYDEIAEEVDRLAEIGIDNMTQREKLIFTKLATERQKQEDMKSLASIGVKQEAVETDDFKAFADKLNPNLSIAEKYEMYTKVYPKKKAETIGSMKDNTSKDDGIKDFYTYEESLKFTRKDFDKNPKLFEAVQKSMLKW